MQNPQSGCINEDYMGYKPNPGKPKDNMNWATGKQIEFI